MTRERDGDERPQPPAHRADGIANRREHADRDHREPEQRQPGDGVRVSAMMQERTERRRRDPRVDEIGVGEVRSDDAGDEEGAPHRARRTGRERELGERRAHERVREVVQVRFA